MFKKAILGTAILAGASAAIFGTDAYSYICTSTEQVRSELKANVPLEFEIKRAKKEIAELVPDIHRHMHLIAKEEVEIEDLKSKVDRTAENLAEERAEILALRTDVTNQSGDFRFAGRKATPREVRAELQRRFDRFKAAEASHNAREKMLEARGTAVVAAREKLEGMLSMRRELDVQIQNLEARLKMIRAAQSTSEFAVDDSQLAKCKQLVHDLKKRLDTAERTLAYEGEFVSEIRMEREVPKDLEDQVDAYFGSKSLVPDANTL